MNNAVVGNFVQIRGQSKQITGRKEEVATRHRRGLKNSYDTTMERKSDEYEPI
jgi:hypothetical protein